MRKFAFLPVLLGVLLCGAQAYGAKLTSFSVYDREDRVDLMLSFDAPYNGHISQMKQGNIIAISLNELITDKAQSENLSKGIVKKVLITPQAGKTAIAFETSKEANINISSINNKIGLRIRVLSADGKSGAGNSTGSVTSSQNSGAGGASSQNSAGANQGFLASPSALNALNSSNPQNSGAANSGAISSVNSNTNLNSQSAQTNSQQTPLPQSKGSSLEGFDLKNYILVLAVLFGLLIFLWWFKKRLAKTHHFDSKDFKIIFQRALDKNNQFMILEYENKRFVMIIGSSNTLLEIKDAPFSNETSNSSAKNTATNSKAPKEKSFDNFFEENKAKLQKLIQKNN